MTRAERKTIQRAKWAAEQAERDRIAANREREIRMRAEHLAEYQREHPILSGAVPLVDYIPPKGTYVPA
jgi:hypothetical protein